MQKHVSTDLNESRYSSVDRQQRYTCMTNNIYDKVKNRYPPSTVVYVVLARSTAQVVLVIHVIKNPFCVNANNKDADQSVHKCNLIRVLGRTNVLYATSLVCLGAKAKLLRRKPIVLVALAEISETC